MIYLARTKAAIAAMVGGFVGAAVWGIMAYFSSSEVDYFPWVVGGLVGVFSAKAGGKGVPNGAICACSAMIALFLGKYIALEMIFAKEVQPMLETMYEIQKGEAQEFSNFSSKKEWKPFLLKNSYTEASHLNKISDLEMQDFEIMIVPLFEKLNGGMDYEDYQDYLMEESGGKIAAFQDSFSSLDFLFFGLGLFTAFKIGAGSNHGEAAL